MFGCRTTRAVASEFHFGVSKALVMKSQYQSPVHSRFALANSLSGMIRSLVIRDPNCSMA
jgi:hypothetical protein